MCTRVCECVLGRKGVVVVVVEGSEAVGARTIFVTQADIPTARSIRH